MRNGTKEIPLQKQTQSHTKSFFIFRRGHLYNACLTELQNMDRRLLYVSHPFLSFFFFFLFFSWVEFSLCLSHPCSTITMTVGRADNFSSLCTCQCFTSSHIQPSQGGCISLRNPNSELGVVTRWVVCLGEGWWMICSTCRRNMRQILSDQQRKWSQKSLYTHNTLFFSSWTHAWLHFPNSLIFRWVSLANGI